jgi:hypothetical protein
MPWRFTLPAPAALTLLFPLVATATATPRNDADGT